MHSVRALGALFAALSLVILGSCKDDKGPLAPKTPGINFIRGAEATDTIDAALLQALVVEVRDDQGALVPDVVVRFASIPINGQDPFGPFNAYVAPLTAPDGTKGSLTTELTDARGRAAVRVILGNRVGPGRIEVSVPELAYADTATYTITVGGPARVFALPKDTALFTAASMTLRSTVTDRGGNPRTDAVSVRLVSGPVTVQGKTVTGQSVGVAKVVSEVGAFRDTTTVTVVPPGVLAVAGTFGVATVNMDGSGYHVLATNRAAYARWASDGSAITFDNDYAVPARIVTMAGAVRPVRPSSAGTEAEMYPIFSPNREWVYFSVITNGQFKLWRARPDGTSAAPLATNDPADDFYPSPSPDGNRLMYINRIGGGRDTLRILDLNTGNVTRIGVPGHGPSWSPSGQFIAYIDIPAGYVVKVMRPDGTNIRQVSPGGGYEKGVAWSPDEKWLVAYHTSSGRIHLIDVQTGAVLPLGFSAGMMSPSWKPTAAP